MIVKLTLDGPADEIPPLDASDVGAIRPNRQATGPNHGSDKLER
jgi:hypothetical protein